MVPQLYVYFLHQSTTGLSLNMSRNFLNMFLITSESYKGLNQLLSGQCFMNTVNFLVILLTAKQTVMKIVRLPTGNVMNLVSVHQSLQIKRQLN